MPIAWRVEPLDSDSYRFFNFTGGAAEEVKIENDQSSEPIVIHKPVDFVLGTNSFDQHLSPGEYDISWHPAAVGQPEERQSVHFTVPPAGPGAALLETGQ
jgi:hypothetical protein